MATWFEPFYKSNTVRALLVALVAWVLTLIGIAEEASSEEAQRLVGLALELVQGIALAWGVYARTRQPTPALTLTKAEAEKRNAQAEADSAAALTRVGNTGSSNNESPPSAAR